MVTRLNIAFFILFLFSQYSCVDIVEPEELRDYGIPVYEVNIETENYALFNANIFTNYSTIAELAVDGQTFSIRIEHQGYTSRELLKKSYEINFIGSEKDPVIKRSEIVLSAQAIDPGMLRNLLACEIFESAGLKTYKTRPVFLYINDKPEGLYLLTEVINEEFFTARQHSVNELYKAVNTKAQFSFLNGFYTADGFQKRIPDDESYYSLNKLIYLLDTEPHESLPGILDTKLDIDSYLIYSAVSSLIGNWDGIVHNFYLCKHKDTGLFEFIPWDLDRTFFSHSGGLISLNSNLLFDKIMSVPEYRNKYHNYYYWILNDILKTDTTLTKLYELKNLIAESYKADRWFEANGYNLENEYEKIVRFIQSTE